MKQEVIMTVFAAIIIAILGIIGTVFFAKRKKWIPMLICLVVSLLTILLTIAAVWLISAIK